MWVHYFSTEYIQQAKTFILINKFKAELEHNQFLLKIFLYYKDLDLLVLQNHNELFPDGPGEMGRPVILPSNISENLKKGIDEGWKKNAFNQYISDLISLRRSLPDPRDEW